MKDIKRVKTVCRSCHGGCGVIVTVEDGKAMKVEPNPDFPIGGGTLCAKGLAITQLAYHPDRIIYPMKKAKSGWTRITWDEALDTVANKFKEVIAKHGPEAILVGQFRDYLEMKVRTLLMRRKRKRKTSVGWRRWSNGYLYGVLGLFWNWKLHPLGSADEYK